MLIIKHGAWSTAVMLWGLFSVMWTIDACEVCSVGWVTAEMLSHDISFALGHTLLQVASIVWEGQMISQENILPTLEPHCLRQTSDTSICMCIADSRHSNSGGFCQESTRLLENCWYYCLRWYLTESKPVQCVAALPRSQWWMHPPVEFWFAWSVEKLSCPGRSCQ